MFKAYYQMSHCKMPAREWRIRSPYQKTAEKIFLLTVSVYINISSQSVYLVNSFRLRVDFINPLAMFLHLPHLRTVFWALQVDLESGTAPDAMPRNTTVHHSRFWGIASKRKPSKPFWRSSRHLFYLAQTAFRTPFSAFCGTAQSSEVFVFIGSLNIKT